ncbi:hypothetical protein A0H76_260 [Hepatospora eriocheir]|uniref:Uncharacterized protein n=1 Tax=Hepatospora eriocheir TaxID=1081669 RepID=A0A1X0QDX4_9MICR|nr:hypothetical protein A0H76_260 [Hepatospora eriocheir]
MLKLKDLVNESFGINMSMSKVNRCLRQFHYTLKQVSFVLERSCDQIIEQKLDTLANSMILKNFIKIRTSCFWMKLVSLFQQRQKKTFDHKYICSCHCFCYNE